MADKKFKEELKRPDDFESFVQNAYEAMRDRKKEILAGIIVFIVLVGGFLTYQVRKEGLNVRAADAFSRLMETWPMADPASAMSGQEEPQTEETPETWEKFDSAATIFLEEYESSSMVPMAKLYQARAKLALGNYDAALELYRSSDIRTDRELKILAEEGEGYALFSQKKWAEAQTVFQNLVSMEDNPLSEAHQWYLARSHDELGNSEQAKELYKKISEESPQSPFAEKARLRLARLSQSENES